MVLSLIRAELLMMGYSHATVSFLQFYHMSSISTADTVLRLNTSCYLRRGKTWSLPRWSLPVSEWFAPGWQLGQREKTEQKKSLVWGVQPDEWWHGGTAQHLIVLPATILRHTLSMMKFPCSVHHLYVQMVYSTRSLLKCRAAGGLTWWPQTKRWALTGFFWDFLGCLLNISVNWCPSV